MLLVNRRRRGETHIQNIFDIPQKKRGRYLKKRHIFTAFGCFQQN